MTSSILSHASDAYYIDSHSHLCPVRVIPTKFTGHTTGLQLIKHLYVLERHLDPIPTKPPQIRRGCAGQPRWHIAQERDQLHQRDLEVRGVGAGDGKAGDSERVPIFDIAEPVEATVDGVLESIVGGGQRFCRVVEVQNVVCHRERGVFEVQDEPGFAPAGAAGGERHRRLRADPPAPCDQCSGREV